MTKELTIECPKCNHVFSADEALQKHLKNKQEQITKQLKEQEKKISQKIRADFEKNAEFCSKINNFRRDFRRILPECR